MTLHEYIQGIEKASESSIPEGSSHWIVTAERYAILLNAIQSRSPAVLHSGIERPDNKVSRKLFTEETGIVLPNTQAGSRKVLTEWAGADQVREYMEELDRKAKEGQRIREERQAEAERKRLETVRDKFRKGDFIDARDFLEIARQLGAEVHPRTAGSIKKVKSISKEGSYYRMGRYPNVRLNGNTILPLVQLILGEPDTKPEPDTEEDALARQLFTPGETNIPSLVA